MTNLDIYEKPAKIVFLSIGSNLGDKKQNIEIAKNKLRKKNIEIVESSKNYESFSWPNKNNPKFINIILKIRTKLSPIDLLDNCLKIEKQMGRVRNKKYEPRICDIDIIDYNGEIIDNYFNKGLVLPHPQMHKRNFVLIPLFEISKNWIHPLKKANINRLISSLKIEDLRTIKLV